MSSLPIRILAPCVVLAMPLQLPDRSDRPRVRLDLSLNLTLEQHLAVMELIPIAMEEKLFGCTCAAKGKSMPCECIIESVLDDPARELIREAEERSGEPGIHNLITAARKVALRHPKEFAASKHPLEPCDIEPGSVEKIKFLQGRVARGEAVGREGDLFHNPDRMAGEGEVGGAWEEEEDYYGD